MTRYTELRHAGYYQDGLTKAEQKAIADKVDNAGTRTTTPKGSTTTSRATTRKAK